MEQIVKHFVSLGWDPEQARLVAWKLMGSQMPENLKGTDSDHWSPGYLADTQLQNERFQSVMQPQQPTQEPEWFTRLIGRGPSEAQ